MCSTTKSTHKQKPIPGPSVAKVEALCKKTGMHVIFGMPELSDKAQSTVYNTAVLSDPKASSVNTTKCIYPPTACLRRNAISAADMNQQPFKRTSATLD